MKNPVFKWILPILGLSVVLLLGTQLTARANPFAAAPVLAPGSCTLPCWHGIQPGRTTLAEADSLLRADRDITGIEHRISPVGKDQLDELCWQTVTLPGLTGCVRTFGPTTTTALASIDFVLPSPALTVGDAIAMFGKPVSGQTCIVYIHGQHRTSGGQLDFGHGVRVMLARISSPSLLLTPYTPVTRISYARENLTGGPQQLAGWRGFRGGHFVCDDTVTIVD